MFGLSLNDPPVGFAFRLNDATERLKGWSQESDLRLLGYWFNNYSDQAVEVAGVDLDEGIIRSRQPSAYSTKENQRFFAYNALSELDVPGEWYLDRRSGVLYLYPTDTAPGAPVLLTGYGGWQRDWVSVPAAVEFESGAGRWAICQVSLENRLRTNPAASLFAMRLLDLLPCGSMKAAQPLEISI